MKIPNFRRFTPEDYPQYADADGERFLQHLNEVFEGLNTPLQGRLSLRDNFNTEVKTFDVAQDTEYIVDLLQLRGRCIDIQVYDADLYDYCSVAWEHISRSQLRLKISFDSAPIVPTQVTLLFMGE